MQILDSAIIAAAKMSHRYITDRQLPDKAIDLIDEAASRIKMEIDSKPEALDKLDRRLIQLKMQLEAVKKMKMSAVKLKSLILKNRLLKSRKNTTILKKSGSLKNFSRRY